MAVILQGCTCQKGGRAVTIVCTSCEPQEEFWLALPLQLSDFSSCPMQTLYAFMEGSPVRHAVMEKISQEVESQLKTLKHKMGMQSGRMAAVKQNYSIIIQALQEIIKTTYLADAKIKARGLIHELNSFNFIFTLHMMHPILQMVVDSSSSRSQLTYCNDRGEKLV
ncbi:unnamed protein product [Natator depressus]